MLCIDNTILDPYFNISAEEYLLKNFADDVFMLWQNEPSIIVGRHQNVKAEINLDFAASHDLKIVRRFSGGGTVFHDLGNLNLTFIETNSNVNFNKFTDEIVEFLSKLGIKAQVDARRAINIDGLKISGSAQCIHKNRVMFHATLLFSSNLEKLNTSLEGDETALINSSNTKKRYVPSVKSQVVNISEYTPKSFTIDDLKQFIINYFLEKNMENKLYNFSQHDINQIDNLKDEKYATEDWTFNAYSLK